MTSGNKYIDLSILKKSPELTKHATLEIIPLAPLSMVSEMPGAYYKTLKSPNKKMICGLFENILGWHFSQDIRSKIIIDIKKERILKDEEQYSKGSSYQPLLMEYFDFKEKEKVKLDKIYKDKPISFCLYKDVWNRARRRHSEYPQMSGARHLTPMVIHELDVFLGTQELSPTERKNKTTEWMQTYNSSAECENWQRLPSYYYSPTPREFITFEAKFIIPIDIDEELLRILKENGNKSVSYLGTSESWIELKITEV